MTNKKRTGKFYRKNEAEVMESLGLKPTKNSGSGWVEKEDGQNEYVICQLKSTDANSIKINLKDIQVLEFNAATTHKLPLFAIQFLGTQDVWLMAKPIDFTEVAKYIESGQCKVKNTFLDIETSEEGYIEHIQKKLNKTMVSSSECARIAFNKEREQKWNKTKGAK